MTLPRLHVVTDDDVLAEAGFRARATALILRHGSDLAMHLRGPRGPVRRLLAEAEALAPPAADSGTLLVVNDRPDVALAAGVPGLQLGHRSIPVQAARSLLGPDVLIGYSAHGAPEAASAAANGADFVVIGTIWASGSHPERGGAGLERVRETVRAVDVPVLTIGAVTPDRARESLEVGAWGVAVIRGVWSAEDPVEAAATYLKSMGVDSP